MRILSISLKNIKSHTDKQLDFVGGVNVLSGPNGAGKTTTVRLATGALASDEGEIKILGLDPRVDGPAQLEHVAAVARHVVACAIQLLCEPLHGLLLVLGREIRCREALKLALDGQPECLARIGAGGHRMAFDLEGRPGDTRRCPDQGATTTPQGRRPTGIVEGNKYDTSIAAEIITGKFSYHMPIYRQQDYFAGSGWTPGRSTLLNILTGSFFVIEPLLEEYLLRS